MKPFELREFSADELKQKLHDLHEEFMSIRFKKQAETPKPSDIKKIKREARVGIGLFTSQLHLYASPIFPGNQA